MSVSQPPRNVPGHDFVGAAAHEDRGRQGRGVLCRKLQHALPAATAAAAAAAAGRHGHRPAAPAAAGRSQEADAPRDRLPCQRLLWFGRAGRLGLRLPTARGGRGQRLSGSLLGCCSRHRAKGLLLLLRLPGAGRAFFRPGEGIGEHEQGRLGGQPLCAAHRPLHRRQLMHVPPCAPQVEFQILMNDANTHANNITRTHTPGLSD